MLENYATDAFLLDAYSKAGLGGTGETFNWELAIEAQKFGKPIFLAGGLTPENVAEAVKTVNPFAVDVSDAEAKPASLDTWTARRDFRSSCSHRSAIASARPLASGHPWR